MTAGTRTQGLAEPLTVGGVGAAALALINPPDTGAPWCPSVLLFSTPCPLCGLTRGVARLVRGDVEASLTFHPVAWLVLLVVVGGWLAWIGRRAGWWQWRSKALERGLLWTLGVGLVVVWIVRAVTGTLPPISG